MGTSLTDIGITLANIWALARTGSLGALTRGEKKEGVSVDIFNLFYLG